MIKRVNMYTVAFIYMKCFMNRNYAFVLKIIVTFTCICCFILIIGETCYFKAYHAWSSRSKKLRDAVVWATRFWRRRSRVSIAVWVNLRLEITLYQPSSKLLSFSNQGRRKQRKRDELHLWPAVLKVKRIPNAHKSSRLWDSFTWNFMYEKGHWKLW